MEPFLCEIRIWGLDFAPRGWAHCDGQALPINQNQAVFALLGTRYGGNGQTIFNLPDLRGRVPVSWGGPYATVGIAGGEENHTLTQSEMPQHTHTVAAVTAQSDSNNGNIPGADSLPAVSAGGTVYGPPTALTGMSTQMVSSTGGSQPHDNMMPYTALNFCIALLGVFPSHD